MSTVLLAATAPDVATFAIAAVVVIGGALGVVGLRNPVHAALSLVATLFGVAVLFVALQAHFLAAVQVIIYGGAVVVMFLFVIMLLGVDRTERLVREPRRAQRPLALVVALSILGLLVALARGSWEATGAPSQGGALSGPGSDVAKIADIVFTRYLFPFEATSVLLVIAVVGAVALARRPQVRLRSGAVVEADELPPSAMGGEIDTTDAPVESTTGSTSERVEPA